MNLSPQSILAAGQVSPQSRFLGTVSDGRRRILTLRQFERTRRASRNRDECPDNFPPPRRSSRSKSWNPRAEDLAAIKTKLKAGLEQYRRTYAAYKRREARQLAALRDPNQTVVAHPLPAGRMGQGTSRKSRVNAEFYNLRGRIMTRRRSDR